MTPDEFITRAMGMPWADKQSGWDGSDCYGLLMLWMREVEGVAMTLEPRLSVEFGVGSSPVGWVEIETPEPYSTAWMTWRDGVPTHCGVVLPNEMLLHSEHHDRDGVECGGVRVTRLSVIKRACGKIKYYKMES